MTIRRDFLLQQLGIIQWQLRYPMVLHGEVALKLATGTRLLIVSTENISADDQLLNDVLRGLSLTKAQVMFLTPEQYVMLGEGGEYLCWWLGSDERAPGKAQMILRSPVLTALYNNPEAKRALWQQICHDEQYFLSDGC